MKGEGSAGVGAINRFYSGPSGPNKLKVLFVLVPLAVAFGVGLGAYYKEPQGIDCVGCTPTDPHTAYFSYSISSAFSVSVDGVTDDSYVPVDLNVRYMFVPSGDYDVYSAGLENGTWSSEGEFFEAYNDTRPPPSELYSCNATSWSEANGSIAGRQDAVRFAIGSAVKGAESGFMLSVHDGDSTEVGAAFCPADPPADMFQYMFDSSNTVSVENGNRSVTLLGCTVVAGEITAVELTVNGTSAEYYPYDSVNDFYWDLIQ